MGLRAFKQRLSRIKEIHITGHARIRAEERQVNLKEVEKNLRNPKRLIQVKKDDDLGKFNCWFEYSKSQGHRYTIVINDKTKVITIIKIRSRWQREVEKHAKKIPSRLRSRK